MVTSPLPLKGSSNYLTVPYRAYIKLERSLNRIRMGVTQSIRMEIDLGKPPAMSSGHQPPWANKPYHSKLVWHIFVFPVVFRYDIWQVLPSHNIFLLQDFFADFLSCNKKVMKIIVHIIWVLTHSDIKFECKNQFCKYVKNYRIIQ